MELLKAEQKVNQQEGEEEIKCYTIWQIMVALVHSNRQLRTEVWIQRKDVNDLLYSRRLLTLGSKMTIYMAD